MFFNRKKKQGGFVYLAESTRKNGVKKVYTGKTTRTPFKRWGEHISSVHSSNKKTWVSKGTYVRPMGAVWSSNPTKAEKTIKKMSSTQKRSFARYAAKKYKRKMW